MQQISDLPRTKIIRNGEKVGPTFSAGDMGRRNATLREHMAENGIEAVVFTSYQNIDYYSDFLYTSFGRTYGLVVTQDRHVTVSANIDAGMPWRRSFDDNVVYTDWQRGSFYLAVQEILKQAGFSKGKVGVEYHHINLDMQGRLRDALPGADLVDVASATMARRMVKSPEEIELIKNGARIGDIGGAAVVEAIDEGDPEYEVALHGTQAMVREIARTYPHAELRDTWVWFQSGINTDGAHNWPTSRKIRRGDILSLNCFPMISG